MTRSTATHHQSANRTSTTISKRTLKSQVSLSNMFEEEEGSQYHVIHPQTHHLTRNATKAGIDSRMKAVQGRLRSLSDTSIYSRPDAATFEREPFNPSIKNALYAKQAEREEDEVSVEYVNEDEEEDFTNIGNHKNEKTLVQHGGDDQGKNGKQTGDDDNQLLSSDDVHAGNNTIGLTEFARMKEKISVVKQ